MKWTSHLTFIQIGRSILVMLILVFTFACGNKFKLPDVYKTLIHNNTSTPIVIHFKKRVYGYNPDDTLKINANDYIVPGIFPVKFKRWSNDDDPYPIKKFFDGFTTVEVSIYRNDSLKVVWSDPAVDLPSSTHSFFNYNSWDIELTPNVADQTGTFNFYIEEADLE